MNVVVALKCGMRQLVLPAMEMNASIASTAGMATGLNSLTVTMVNNPNNPNDNVIEDATPPVTAAPTFYGALKGSCITARMAQSRIPIAVVWSAGCHGRLADPRARSG